jgi:hypothetical protein
MGLFDREPDAPEPVEVAGRALHCQICGNGTFWQRKAQLHGAVATFFNLEWTSPTAACLVCSSCGYVHWFLPLTDR